MTDRNVTADDVLYVHCPKCDRAHEDCDGLGVLYCEHCGYCEHSSMTGDICDFCGAVDDPQDRCPTRERA